MTHADLFGIKLICLRSELNVATFWILMVWVIINNFLLIDATDRIKISSDQKGLFFAVCLYPLSFSINLDATVIFRYNKLLFKAELQGRKVPNIAYLPNVTLNVRFGHAYYDNCFSNSFCAKCNFQLNKLFPK